MAKGRYLGVDHGDVRTGIAVCDESGILATPVAVIQTSNRQKAVEEILALCREKGVVGIVLGLPLNMDGSDGPRAKLARMFGDALAAAHSPPIIYEDERLSSWEAEGRLIEAGVKPGKRKGRVDAGAACIILQRFLDRQAHETASPDKQQL